MDAAIGKRHRLWLLARECWILSLAGDRKESLLRLFNGFDHRGRYRSGSPGTTGNGACWEIGITEHHLDLVVGNACLIADDLRKDSVSAGANILSSAGDPGRAIVTKLNAGFAAHALGDPGAAGNTPPQNEAVFLHGSDLWSAPRPAEFLRAYVEALHHVTGREGQIETFIFLGLIQDAQLDRIHVELDGQLVHRGFKRE